MVPGGYDNDISGNVSFAFGYDVDVTQDTTAVFFSLSNPGYFGINTVSPSCALEVNGNIAADEVHAQIGSTGACYDIYADSIYGCSPPVFVNGGKFLDTLTGIVATFSGDVNVDKLVLDNAEISTSASTLSFTDGITGTKTLAELAEETYIYNRTTGWLEGGQITINAGDNTKIDVTAGSVLIVNSSTPIPIYEIISWSSQTALDPGLSTRSKWIGVKDDGAGNAEFVYDIEFDAVERRSSAIIGRIWDTGGSGPQITNVGDYERPAWGLLTAFQDFIVEYGSWNISGNIYSANGTNLLLDKSVGKSYRYHAEDVIGQENVHTDAAQLAITSYAYHLQGSNTTTSELDIEPDYYDNAGVKTLVPTYKWSIQEVWLFPVSGTCHILYGQILYNSKPDAVDGILTETKIRNMNILDGAILRAYLLVERNCTDLSYILKAEIREAKINTGGGGSGALWTKSGTNISPTISTDDIVLPTGSSLSITDMTTGSIPFIEASGLVVQDNANLFWDDTNNRLGIGTTTPATILHLKDNTGVTIGSGSDADQDLITVDVTGSPKLWWDEATDAFELNKSLTIPGGSLNLGSVTLSEIGGCLRTSDFHAHGDGSVAGYLKLHQGLTPSADKEANHSILWVDASEDLYFQNAAGNDKKLSVMDASNSFSVSRGLVPTTGSDRAAINFGGGGSLIGATADTDALFLANAYYNLGYKYLTSDLASAIKLDDGEIILSTAISGTADDAISWYDALKVAVKNVFIGDIANTKMTQGLTINQGANDDETFSLKSSDVNHSMTNLTESDTYFSLKKLDAGSGGVNIRGLSDADHPGLVFQGVMGTTNPTNSNPAIKFQGIKFNGTTGASSMADDETVLAVQNGGNTVVVMGNGNVGINTVAPTSPLQVVGLSVYADNTAALAGGLTAGAFYRTATGVVMVVY